MAEKIKLNWKRFEMARIAHGTLAVSTPVKIDGMEARIGDYLVRSSGGEIIVLSPEEVDSIAWLDPDQGEVPELETEGE